MEVEIVEVDQVPQIGTVGIVSGKPGETPKSAKGLPRKHLKCPSCGTQDSIFVRIVCTVDFNADYYDSGMDTGVGFSMETADNIEPVGDKQVICERCGTYLDLPEGMRMIQDV